MSRKVSFLLDKKALIYSNKFATSRGHLQFLLGIFSLTNSSLCFREFPMSLFSATDNRGQILIFPAFLVARI